MLLKGHYNTAADRLPIDKYTRFMFDTFSIMIEEPARYGQYTGFIKRNPMYDIYIPFVNDGHIGSLLHHDCRRYSAAGVVDLKLKIKALIKEDPERFADLARCTRMEREAYELRKKENKHPEYYERS